ncbi:MarR family winged helix-turn-helix transcriptional regulator [Evansella cellulosilytica]|uniref:Regulatory protein MarR n=1 Tax=Evansella cellulosilytica (strain ATCC 21833 / DSM 2522 / FERM P-1141 / JCM 9156 / N-4) TaxID=649639 RepID=E6TZZ8_EVAC2|nr:MarR family transcriptional regulator [Evansella cellulosilytica]ADU29002.1 regulatory protein MarR [Evansella cellulosilytica DSM 2522]
MDKQMIMNELEEVMLDINLFLSHRLGNEFTTEITKRFVSLTPNQQMTLFLVDKKGIKHVKDIANFLNISTSAVSQIVAKLEQQDILKRVIDASNRRSTVIEVGQKGKEILNEMDRIKSTIFQRYLSLMEEEDLLVLKNSMRKFLTIIAESKEDHE